MEYITIQLSMTSNIVGRIHLYIIEYNEEDYKNWAKWNKINAIGIVNNKSIIEYQLNPLIKLFTSKIIFAIRKLTNNITDNFANSTHAYFFISHQLSQ